MKHAITILSKGVVLATLSVALAAQAPDFTATATKRGTAVIVKILPPPGHHINAKAPLDLEDLASKTHYGPATVKESEATFKLKLSGSRTFAARAFLCDNAKTYCERHEVQLKWDAGKENPMVPASGSKSGSAKEPTNTKAEPIRHPKGFLVNDPQKALAEAAKLRKPLLIDFFGIWCPPCNMLDEEVFSSSEFQSKTKRFVRVKLDADSPVSWELKSKYKIGGYPTIIFASPDGEEIGRVVGYRPLLELLKEADQAWKLRDEPVSKLKAKADAGDMAASIRLGKLYLERKEFADSVRYLEKAPNQREALNDARIGLLGEAAEKGDKDSTAKMAELLETSIREFGDSVETVERRFRLAEAYELLKNSEKHEAALKDAIKRAEAFAAMPEKLAGHDYMPGDLYEMAASGREQLGQIQEARGIWRKAAEAYGTQLTRSAKGKSGETERGYNLELAYCLWKAGELTKAEQLYSNLQRKYPREFTFYYGAANMNFELKRFDQARDLAQRAFDYSYGDNRLRAATLLARALEKEGKKKDGVAIIRTALQTVPLPSDQTIRTHRYAQKLRELEQSLLK